MSTDAIRAIRRLFPGADIIQSSGTDLSVYGAYSDPPTVRDDVRLVEDETLRAHPISGEPIVAFAAFLDGIQEVRIMMHERGVPIIFGGVAAAIRVRRDRRFATWNQRGPETHRALYFPRRHVRHATLDDAEMPIVDTSADIKSLHPAAMRAVALDRIRRARESAERTLGEAWCTGETAPLFVDGGIGGSAIIASTRHAVGVIKSHQTLYARDNSLGTVLTLERGERSSVFVVESNNRPTVASWYLRLRDPHGQDAMFGLVRVEVADQGNYTERANEVSRWIMAEVAPIALPDSRWDKMMYGVRDCEEFLRAIAS